MKDKNDNKDKLRPYEVDGLQEYDNPLPSWWLLLFYGCIIYGVIYMIYIHMAGGPKLDEELVEQLQTAEVVQVDSATTEQAPQETRTLSQRLQDQAYIDQGKAHFATYCSPCHRPDGGGSIGPNLTDGFWIHGCKAEEIIGVITNGVLEKGMAAWGPILGTQKVEEVAAYVISLQGSQPPDPKPNDPRAQACQISL